MTINEIGTKERVCVGVRPKRKKLRDIANPWISTDQTNKQTSFPPTIQMKFQAVITPPPGFSMTVERDVNVKIICNNREKSVKKGFIK